MTDKKRNYEKKIEELLGFFPVVIILGTRQCGKTTLAKKLRPNWRYFDLERSRQGSRDFGAMPQITGLRSVNGFFGQALIRTAVREAIILANCKKKIKILIQLWI